MTSPDNELQRFCRANEVGITCYNLFLSCFGEGHLEDKNYYKTGSFKAFTQLYYRKVLLLSGLSGLLGMTL